MHQKTVVFDYERTLVELPATNGYSIAYEAVGTNGSPAVDDCAERTRRLNPEPALFSAIARDS